MCPDSNDGQTNNHTSTQAEIRRKSVLLSQKPCRVEEVLISDVEIILLTCLRRLSPI